MLNFTPNHFLHQTLMWLCPQRYANSRRDLKIHAYDITFYPSPKLQNSGTNCGVIQCSLEEVRIRGNSSTSPLRSNSFPSSQANVQSSLSTTPLLPVSYPNTCGTPPRQCFILAYCRVILGFVKALEKQSVSYLDISFTVTVSFTVCYFLKEYQTYDPSGTEERNKTPPATWHIYWWGKMLLPFRKAACVLIFYWTVTGWVG